MNQKINFKLAALATAVTLAACGGGGSGGGGSSDTNQTGSDSVTLSGQVVDGPIVGAQVCLFIGGAQAVSSLGTAICSSATDAQGNYTITIPRSLNPGFVTLIASKDSNIKLASSLGTLAQVLEAAGNTGKVTPANLAAARVTHFTTADFALADTNEDGTVSKSEADSYVQDFTKVRKAASIIKAVVDFGGQAGSLIGGQTTNTLELAFAAARNQPLGSSTQTVDQWFADPANAEIIAAVDKDVANELEGSFSNYQLSTTVNDYSIPPVVERNGGSESIFCGIETANTTSNVQIALDATRRIAVMKWAPDGEGDEGGQIVGEYNPQTGEVILEEYSARHAVMTSPSGVTYYSEFDFQMDGIVNTATGSISGPYSEMSATMWNLDDTRQECWVSGTFTATKL